MSMSNEEACLEFLKMGFISNSQEEADRIREAIKKALIALRNQPKWIPFKKRELDAEEKEEHPEWDYILCGKLPDDHQRILVNIKYKSHELVQIDNFYNGCDCCELESGYELVTEATAWMSLPEPYEGGNAE